MTRCTGNNENAAGRTTSGGRYYGSGTPDDPAIIHRAGSNEPLYEVLCQPAGDIYAIRPAPGGSAPIVNGVYLTHNGALHLARVLEALATGQRPPGAPDA